ncbi:MAG: hypothetical protein UU18_C0011G0023 [Parcubacteria group bacterium GW2011_GWB2_40_8]|nr:MAG: hypothetical protein UT71_C0002G0040 [Parcubacteria group bacterium GW2011_GWF2_40_10]KKR47817.1 MAG: hypothetical protein UT83_C0003G0030 [Parcubacteria group bacterium GW2011_GWA2_40_143]KKR60248.1 MAG: hypothetical protein UT97_C0003G0030 [Parcubacteria group bacterium GW2011_GWC2_40_31]KKR75218.1 MAG: hypothetical protein UU18_C0011G0023 [Parcubacteria group bacterium GW2011_GWB2_40_8]KKR77396.1 MAG: hypothetical protein UU20_C0008G0009 [Parcubacteria group bacterium GW2011_GWE2_40_
MVSMEIYHIVNRGVDKRKIFTNDKDRFRFVHNLFEFNDQDNVVNNVYFFEKPNTIDVRRQYKKKKRKLLVVIHAFCLMDNHYHLLVSSKVNGGIPKFMKKINMGYSKYFNIKYDRSGALFEGRHKKILIKDEAHFIHLPYYIHLNPLDFVAPEWRERKIKDFKKVVDFINSYRWSSHLDYIGKNNFPSVTQRNFLLDFFGGEKEYMNSIKQWVKDMDINDMGKIVLE